MLKSIVKNPYFKHPVLIHVYILRCNLLVISLIFQNYFKNAKMHETDYLEKKYDVHK